MKFVFGDIVVVDGNQIGVVLKCWGESSNGKPPHCEVYVRSYNLIAEYSIYEMERYQVRHKELDEEEIEYQREAETAS